MNEFEGVDLAAGLHVNQQDKLGWPYIGHCVRVMLRLPGDATLDEKLAALFHDSIEDGKASPEYLFAKGVPHGALCIIEALTRRPDETYAEFIARIIAAGRSAIRVKLADIEDNRDPRRLAHLAEFDPATATRLAAKYETAAIALTAALTDPELVVGRFYWVIPALDVDTDLPWEKEQQPARYAGKNAAGEDLWHCLNLEDPSDWPMRWIGPEIALPR